MDTKNTNDDDIESIGVVDAPLEEKAEAKQDAPAREQGGGVPPKSPENNDDRNSFKARLQYFLNEKLSKKQLIIGGVIFVLLLGGAVAFALSRHAAAPTPEQKAAMKAKTPITSPLTGLPVSAADAKRSVTGVMIENSIFARPQSGLREAGVVFEGIAEAGITRFLALYQEAKPKNLGPVRSARPYFLMWAKGFDAPLAHVGGSPEALADIKGWHVKDLDQFFNAAYYHRISSREAPHNMYTSMAQLNAAEKSHGWTTSHFTGFVRGKEKPSKNPTATSVNFNISSATYHAHYTYDPTHNFYLRSEGGAPHVDATTGKRLTPKVVIALVMQYKLEADGYHSNYNTLGSGHMYVFQNGTVTQGTWKKSVANKQFQFLDGQGKPIKLNPGQTWISVVGSKGDVSFSGPPKPATKPKQ